MSVLKFLSESSETSPIWFVLVPSATFIFGIVLLVSVILVLKRHKPNERRQSDDTPMGAVTSTSTVTEEESYLKFEPPHGGGKEYLRILHKNGTPGDTTNKQNLKIYSRNIYNREDPNDASE